MQQTSRKSSTLSDSLQRHLNAYALAASAAGVGVLTLAQSSQAKIVYTPAHVTIGYGGVHTFSLDLNHDGIADFALDASAVGPSYSLNAYAYPRGSRRNQI